MLTEFMSGIRTTLIEMYKHRGQSACIPHLLCSLQVAVSIYVISLLITVLTLFIDRLMSLFRHLFSLAELYSTAT